MVYDIFLERVAHLVDKVDTHIAVARIHLPAPLVHRHEHRFNTAGGLCHKAGGACGSNGETGDVAPAIFHHIRIEGRIGFFYAQHEGVVLLALAVVDGESSALTCHIDGRPISGQRQRLVHVDREVSSLLCAVSQSHGSYHVSFGGDAYACTSSHAALFLNFLPKMEFGALHLIALGVLLDFLHDEVYLLQLKVHDIIHDSLCLGHIRAEFLIVEISLRSKGVHHIRVKVQAKQSAGVIRTERNLSTRIGRYGPEAQVGIAVGQAFPDDGIPEEHTRLCAFPCIVNDFLPKFSGFDMFFHHGFVASDGELLNILFVFDGTFHEFIVDADRHIGAGHLAFGHLGIDKRLAVGVFDTHREHQSASASILCHLTGRIAVAFHERHQSGAGERRVVHRCSLGAYVREVVSHASPALHELHLLLVYAHDGAIGVGIAVEAYHEAVGERSHLVVVADASHGAAGRHYVAEVVEQFEHLLVAHRIGVFVFYSCYLTGDAPVHVFG